MSTRINHNVLSLTAQRNIWATQNALDTAITRLSSGLRINYAWDDPAGLAVSERMRAQISSMVEAERNTNYNVNLLATAEGALSVIDEKLIRMRSLSIQASNGALTSGDRASLDVEFQQLKSEITRIANTTNYNGNYLLNGDYSGGIGLKFHIGTYNVSGQDYYHINLNTMTAAALGITASELTDTVTAQAAIDTLDSAINSKDNERTRIGSYVERLQNTILNLQISKENAVSAESQIRDADIAAEMSNFVRAQILFSTGASMLAQANMVPQIVAGLVG
ncbi:MAG: flagellin [Candidatus Electryonea clarkiae]|nr:flagellin [Candidatus Electryonea clarkiae]MDP8286201.1 flagellin [Candidatus Electryonea clarkiae]